MCAGALSALLGLQTQGGDRQLVQDLGAMWEARHLAEGAAAWTSAADGPAEEPEADCLQLSPDQMALILQQLDAVRHLPPSPLLPHCLLHGSSMPARSLQLPCPSYLVIKGHGLLIPVRLMHLQICLPPAAAS